MKKINEWFKCINCWKYNPPARRTCRNHCRECFISIHLDENIPGDRKSKCGWKMVPVDYIIKSDDVKIKFKCIKCGKTHWNKVADDDKILKIVDIVIYYKRFI